MMTPLLHYSIVFHSKVKQHLRFIDKKFHSEIQREIEEQLSFEPDLKTRNRKPLNKVSILDSEWELRCGPNNQFRIFYKVYPKEHVVNIVAIGEKHGNRLLIGGVEYPL
jgi:mRNA-degrading endonuclease RelE of RelBE toxin-antitoxin system